MLAIDLHQPDIDRIAAFNRRLGLNSRRFHAFGVNAAKAVDVKGIRIAAALVLDDLNDRRGCDGGSTTLNQGGIYHGSRSMAVMSLLSGGSAPRLPWIAIGVSRPRTAVVLIGPK